MADICTCDELYPGNMGTPDCVAVASEASRFMLAKYTKDDGTINSIPSTFDFTQESWNEHTQRYDDAGALVAPDERWYISPEVQNPTNLRADAVYQEFDSGYRVKKREGVRTITYTIPEGTPELRKQILSYKCASMGIMFIDTKGNLIGNGSVAGELRFFKINQRSFDVQFIAATATEVQMLMITFDLDSMENDSDIKMFNADEMEVKPYEIEPLYDVVASAPTSITVNGFTMKFSTKYGSISGNSPVKGLAIGDFVLTEVSPTPGAVTLTSVTESLTVPGQYVFVLASAATSADVLKLTLKKVGLDGEQIESTLITIP